MVMLAQQDTSLSGQDTALKGQYTTQSMQGNSSPRKMLLPHASGKDPGHDKDQVI